MASKKPSSRALRKGVSKWDLRHEDEVLDQQRHEKRSFGEQVGLKAVKEEELLANVSPTHLPRHSPLIVHPKEKVPTQPLSLKQRGKLPALGYIDTEEDPEYQPKYQNQSVEDATTPRQHPSRVPRPSMSIKHTLGGNSGYNGEENLTPKSLNKMPILDLPRGIYTGEKRKISGQRHASARYGEILNDRPPASLMTFSPYQNASANGRFEEAGPSRQRQQHDDFRSMVVNDVPFTMGRRCTSERPAKTRPSRYPRTTSPKLYLGDDFVDVDQLYFDIEKEYRSKLLAATATSRDKDDEDVAASPIAKSQILQPIVESLVTPEMIKLFPDLSSEEEVRKIPDQVSGSLRSAQTDSYLPRSLSPKSLGTKPSEAQCKVFDPAKPEPGYLRPRRSESSLNISSTSRFPKIWPSKVQELELVGVDRAELESRETQINTKAHKIYPVLNRCSVLPERPKEQDPQGSSAPLRSQETPVTPTAARLGHQSKNKSSSIPSSLSPFMADMILRAKVARNKAMFEDNLEKLRQEAAREAREAPHEEQVKQQVEEEATNMDALLGSFSWRTIKGEPRFLYLQDHGLSTPAFLKTPSLRSLFHKLIDNQEADSTSVLAQEQQAEAKAAEQYEGVDTSLMPDILSTLQEEEVDPSLVPDRLSTIQDEAEEDNRSQLSLEVHCVLSPRYGRSRYNDAQDEIDLPVSEIDCDSRILYGDQFVWDSEEQDSEFQDQAEQDQTELIDGTVEEFYDEVEFLQDNSKQVPSHPGEPLLDFNSEQGPSYAEETESTSSRESMATARQDGEQASVTVVVHSAQTILARDGTLRVLESGPVEETDSDSEEASSSFREITSEAGDTEQPECSSSVHDTRSFQHSLHSARSTVQSVLRSSISLSSLKKPIRALRHMKKVSNLNLNRSDMEPDEQPQPPQMQPNMQLHGSDMEPDMQVQPPRMEPTMQHRPSNKQVRPSTMRPFEAQRGLLPRHKRNLVQSLSLNEEPESDDSTSPLATKRRRRFNSLIMEERRLSLERQANAMAQDFVSEAANQDKFDQHGINDLPIRKQRRVQEGTTAPGISRDEDYVLRPSRYVDKPRFPGQMTDPYLEEDASEVAPHTPEMRRVTRRSPHDHVLGTIYRNSSGRFVLPTVATEPHWTATANTILPLARSGAREKDVAERLAKKNDDQHAFDNVQPQSLQAGLGRPEATDQSGGGIVRGVLKNGRKVFAQKQASQAGTTRSVFKSISIADFPKHNMHEVLHEWGMPTTAESPQLTKRILQKPLSIGAIRSQEGEEQPRQRRVLKKPNPQVHIQDNVQGLVGSPLMAEADRQYIGEPFNPVEFRTPSQMMSHVAVLCDLNIPRTRAIDQMRGPPPAFPSMVGDSSQASGIVKEDADDLYSATPPNSTNVSRVSSNESGELIIGYQPDRFGTGIDDGTSEEDKPLENARKSNWSDDEDDFYIREPGDSSTVKSMYRITAREGPSDYSGIEEAGSAAGKKRRTTILSISTISSFNPRTQTRLDAETHDKQIDSSTRATSQEVEDNDAASVSSEEGIWPEALLTSSQQRRVVFVDNLRDGAIPGNVADLDNAEISRTTIGRKQGRDLKKSKSFSSLFTGKRQHEPNEEKFDTVQVKKTIKGKKSWFGSLRGKK